MIQFNVERYPEGTLRLAFYGRGGIGSEGNEDGVQMDEAIRTVLLVHPMQALLLDYRGLEYRYGNWLFSVPVRAVRVLGVGRVCVVAEGETRESMGELGTFGGLIPTLNGIKEARDFLTSNPPHGAVSDYLLG